VKKKIIFFDFDNTTTKIHVFAQLQDFAVTERGQIRKLEELNQSEQNWVFNDQAGFSARVEVKTGSDRLHWSTAALGGPDGVKDLRNFYKALKAEGVPIFIITKGFVGAVRKTLEAENLLEYVEKVIGFTGLYPGRTETDFDKNSVERPDCAGKSDSDLTRYRSKADFIQKELERRGLTAEQAILVEDDPEEVKSVEEATPKICRGKLIRERKGMTRPDMKELLEMVGSEASF
jgi:phosphoglycolate phosphatase-like HAD superfamily hydrolase